ncbi:conserved hypothetical protein [Desulfamplus magnetovallimortis]|uniref:LPS biosynthesis protein WbpG n=1 Tax=Desulfamplus magnetovallimortis TaxID=1246637 RepID=A0A1W1HDC9_9BACT|nr:hypothetical protein [Desulfamplus magnetovallimortis]SLM30402.1 conserved hypothetical protein [Desulfamplus magnetovallimortis]
MKEVTRCTRCVLPDCYPNITFDNQGVCSVCQNYKGQSGVLGEEKLRELFSLYKGKGGKYDCLVGTGGGRDSTYVLYAAKKIFNLNVLALNYDNGFRHPQGLANLKKACEILDVDYITSGSKVDKKLLATHLEHSIPYGPGFAKQRMCWPCMTGGKWLLHKTAIEKNIPIILWGFAKPEELSFEDRLFTEDFFGRGSIRKNILTINKWSVIKYMYYIARLRLQFWTPKTGITANIKDIRGRVHPIDRNKNIKEIYFYDYIQWDRRKIKKTLMEELGWKKPDDYVSSWRFDCRLHHTLVNHCFKAMMGFDDLVDGYSNMVRQGYMSRETALRQIEQEEQKDRKSETISILKDELKMPDHLVDQFMSYSK